MSVVKHMIDHAKMGFPYTDENGNLVTNGIIPRTGTLSELLAETGVGEGEVATASDVDAVVVYKGGVPVVYPRNQALSASASISSTSLTPAEAQYSLSVTPTASDPLGMISGGNFVIPTWLPSSRVFVLRISGYFQSLEALTDANTNITIQLKRYNSGVWTNWGDAYVLTCGATGALSEYLPQRTFRGLTRANASQFGIFISHDQTSAYVSECRLTLEILN